MPAMAAHTVEAAMDAFPDPLLVVDACRQVRLANAGASRLFRTSHADLVGAPVDLFLPESSFDLGGPLSSGDEQLPHPRTLELSARRTGGQQFPVELSVLDVDVAGVADLAVERLAFISVRDISGRTRGSDAAVRLATIVQSSQDAIIGKSVDGTVTSWNPGAARLYGYSAEEAIGRSVREFLTPQQSNQEDEVLARVLSGERAEPYEAQRTRRNGVVIDVSISMSSILASDGQIIGFSTAARDISERKRAEARFSTLLEAAPDAVLGVRSNGHIALLNAAAERLFGYSRDELVGRQIENLVPDAARSRHHEYRQAYAADPVPRRMGIDRELAGRRRDGSTFPAEISLSSLLTEEGLLVLASVRDVTERQEAMAEQERLQVQAQTARLEHQLHQSQRLESLGQLAGGVAHDFNNLLSVILNYSLFVRESVTEAQGAHPEEPWETVAGDIAQIERAAHRAAELTSRLLTFGRRDVIAPRVLDLNEVLRAVEPILQRTLGERVRLVMELNPDTPPVLADPGQLEQVVVNLAVNARDAMEGEGVLTMSTRPAGDRSTLTVRDNGPGMEPGVRQRAFDPFFTTKPKGEGSGLGLATVYGIVQQAQGAIEIESAPGHGTSIVVLLPASDQPTAPVPTDPVAPPPEIQMARVLLVEDEPAVRELIMRLLKHEGFAIDAAENGADALERVARDPVDLLITDVVMPGMLGTEVAQRALLLRPELRVLFISGYAHPALAVRGTPDETFVLLEKPFTGPELLAKIREVLSAAVAPTGAAGRGAVPE
jgi:PAS domain S-box-containing protein